MPKVKTGLRYRGQDQALRQLINGWNSPHFKNEETEIFQEDSSDEASQHYQPKTSKTKETGQNLLIFSQRSAGKRRHAETHPENNENADKENSTRPTPMRSIVELPAYQSPPPGSFVSHAYTLDPKMLEGLNGILASIKSKISLKEVKDIFSTVFQKMKQTPELIKSIYNQFTPEEQAYIEGIAKQVQRYHLSQIAMSALNINPINLVILSLLMNAGKVSAENFTFIDGKPAGAYDVCSGVSGYLCEQFYVQENGKTVLQGASVLFDYHQGASLDELMCAWPCGDRKHLKLAVKSLLEDPKIHKMFDTEWCDKNYDGYMHKYNEMSPVMAIINSLKGLSKEACHAFSEKNGDVEGCIKSQLPDPLSGIEIAGITIFSCLAASILCLVGYARYKRKRIAEICCCTERPEEEPMLRSVETVPGSASSVAPDSAFASISASAFASVSAPASISATASARASASASVYGSSAATTEELQAKRARAARMTSI